jgi:hypothetical protein
MRMRSSVLSTLVVLVIATAAASARADDPRAEELYTEGKALAQKSQYAEACPKFEESQKLEPAIGTQFNLADCYEHTKRPAMALALFREVQRVAQLTGKQERQRAAEERITTLEASVPRLRIITAKEVPGLAIFRDGEPVPKTASPAGVPVDPGEHVVRATAAGYEPWATRVTVENGTISIAIPELVLEPKPVLPPPPPPAQRESSSPLAIAGIGTASAGALGLVIGSVFGVTAMSRKDTAACDGIDCRNATPKRAQALRDAQDAGNLSTIFFVAGGALVTTGVTLWLLAPSRVKASASTSGDRVGVVLDGSF